MAIRLDLQQENIVDEYFDMLLDICFREATHFSFTVNMFLKKDLCDKFFEELSAFHERTIITSGWYCFGTVNSDLEVHLFKADIEAKSIIRKHYNNIFLNDDAGDLGGWPEDLCFFVEKDVLLGTVSHEDICGVYPFTEETANEFRKLGEWGEPILKRPYRLIEYM